MSPSVNAWLRLVLYLHAYIYIYIYICIYIRSICLYSLVEQLLIPTCANFWLTSQLQLCWSHVCMHVSKIDSCKKQTFSTPCLKSEFALCFARSKIALCMCLFPCTGCWSVFCEYMQTVSCMQHFTLPNPCCITLQESKCLLLGESFRWTMCWEVPIFQLFVMTRSSLKGCGVGLWGHKSFLCLESLFVQFFFLFC